MQLPSTLARLRPRSANVVPRNHRSNFLHLYGDIGWFGVLSGSAIAFISVYLVRIGASAFQIGLANAGPAIIALALSLPSGLWLQHRRLDRAVFRSSVLFRLFYLLWIPIPLLFSDQVQVSLYVLIIFLMSIPGTLLTVGFNAFFAEVVPQEWRGHVVGVRNAVLALTFMATSLICGVLLETLPYPAGYQAVFAIGFVGAAMSSLHLKLIRLQPASDRPAGDGRSIGDPAQPGRNRTSGDDSRPGIGLRYLTRPRRWRLPSADLLRGSFGVVLAVLFAFHLAQYLPIPLYPIYWVDKLNLSDQAISTGNALFYGAMFLASTQLAKLSRRFGNHLVFVGGAVLLSGYPAVTALAQGMTLYLVASVLGGVGSAFAGGALGNYLLEKVPVERRSMSLGWYVLILNAAILLASLGGPLIAQFTGLGLALFLCAAGRALTSLIVWKWGK
ncbi:MAG TPA: MFS transporter [Anaerolineales bacterium]|nr:MFS transporter [Anaerolineales bacterium]